MTAKQGLNLLLSSAAAVTATLLFQPDAQAVAIRDPLGDFLPTYTGPKGGDLDALGAEVTLKGDRLPRSPRSRSPIIRLSSPTAQLSPPSQDTFHGCNAPPLDNARS